MATETEPPPAANSASAAPLPDRGYVPLHPLWEMTRARLIEFFREPEAIFWVYGFPLLMSLALGIAFRNQPVEEVRLAVIDGPGASLLAQALGSAGEPAPAVSARAAPGMGDAPPRTGEATSREPATVSQPAGGPARRFVVEVLDEATCRRKLRVGQVALVLRPAPLTPSQPRPRLLADLEIDYLYDPTRPESVSAQAATADALERAAGRRDLVASRQQHLTEPGGRYIDFLVPGLIGASLMGGGLMGVGFVTVDLRVRNLLKRLVTTPMRPSHFFGGLMLSRFFFMVTEVCLLLVFAWLIFGVSIAGSWLLLFGLVCLGAWTFAGVGLLVASRARTLETASGLINLIMLPMWVASGIFFSADRFPDLVQPIIQILPLTALIDSLRAVMLEGAGPGGVASDALILAAWSVASFVLAFRWFRWT